MSDAINPPYYPVIVWPASLAITVDVTINGVTTAIPVDNAGRYAWGVTSILLATSGSIADAVRDAVATHAGASSVAAVYTQQAVAGVPWLYRVQCTTASISSAPTITFASADDALACGYAGGTVWTATPVSGTTPATVWRWVSDCNHVGYFCPYSQTTRDYRDNLGRTAVTESADGSTRVVIDWPASCQRDLEFPFLQAGQMLRYRAADSRFAGPLGRDVDDLNNLFENLVVACRSNGVVLRVWGNTPGTGITPYREAAIVDVRALNSVMQYASDVSARGRLWGVTLPLRDLTSVNGSTL